jgi:hypothetical protein
LAANIDIKIVQEQFGHSSRAITSDTYTTVLPEVARAARSPQRLGCSHAPVPLTVLSSCSFRGMIVV